MGSAIYTVKKRPTGVAVLRGLRQTGVVVNNRKYQIDELNPSLEKFNDFWELMETIKAHGYLRASMSLIGRSAVGAWWGLRRQPEYRKQATERQRKRLFSFYNMSSRSWDNIKDFQSMAYKLMIGAMYLRYFGQVAYQIIRDADGIAVGLDHLPGMVIPNVDERGYFKSPAFVQYPTNDMTVRVEFKNPRDIVFITNPDWEGATTGGTDIESITSTILPIDLYLQTAAREYLKNRNTPEVVYSVPADISDEGFNLIVSQFETKHSGVNNIGRNPIVVQGEFSVHELKPLPASLPYQQSRQQSRDEELAVAGVSGAKLGISDTGDAREMRREFHEASMIPLFKFIEQGFYEQIHVREFDIRGWQFIFNHPDFLNAVEKATVHMRYRQMGVLNANEVRNDIGLEPRTDEQGNLYEGQEVEDEEEPEDDPLNDNNQGSPPEGREPEPDDPSQTGEPTLDDQDPPRGDQHDEERRIFRSIKDEKSPPCRQEDEDEEDCVGRKIPEIMDENPDMDQDQAVAIAHEMCSESCEDKSAILKELRTWKDFVIRRLKKGKTLRDFKVTYIPGEVKAIIEAYLKSINDVSDAIQIFKEAEQAIGEV